MQSLYIAVFGLIGIFSRYWIDAFAMRWPTSIPYATFSINVLGSLTAGIIYVLGVERGWISDPLRIGLLVGFAGGFTTFSTYCLQSLLLMEKGQWTAALLYFVLSPLAGIAAAFAGVAIARHLV